MRIGFYVWKAFGDPLMAFSHFTHEEIKLQRCEMTFLNHTASWQPTF